MQYKKELGIDLPIEQFTNIALVTIVVDYLIKIHLSCFDQTMSVKYILDILKLTLFFFTLFGVFYKGVLLLLSMFSFWP